MEKYCLGEGEEGKKALSSGSQLLSSRLTCVLLLCSLVRQLQNKSLWGLCRSKESEPSCLLILPTPTLKGAAMFVSVLFVVVVAFVGELSEKDGQLRAWMAQGRNRHPDDLRVRKWMDGILMPTEGSSEQER